MSSILNELLTMTKQDLFQEMQRGLTGKDYINTISHIN